MPDLEMVVLAMGDWFDASPLENCTKLRYAELQREAIRAAATEKLLLVTGGPGTGKTTTLRGILDLYDRMHCKTLLAAPTGRAAKRLSELTGRDASTVHRLLEVDVSPEDGRPQSPAL